MSCLCHSKGTMRKLLNSDMLTKPSLTSLAGVFVHKQLCICVFFPLKCIFTSEVIPTSFILCTDFLRNIVLMILSAKTTLKQRTHKLLPWSTGISTELGNKACRVKKGFVFKGGFLCCLLHWNGLKIHI